jgi:hypothetical protein
MNDIYPNKTISKCQALANNKEFICADCRWSKEVTDHNAYCSKTGFLCNGTQLSPVHWCLEFELKGSDSSAITQRSGGRKEGLDLSHE